MRRQLLKIVSSSNQAEIKKSIFWATIVALPILVFLFWLIYFKPPAQASGGWYLYLPFVNAILNTLTSVLLVLGYRMIKANRKGAHIKFMLSAVATSALFLVSYLLYHHYQGDTKFLGEGLVRPIYFFILITHIVLSMVQVPLILTTLWLAFKKKWLAHRKVARITFPIWLYVSVTGVLVFIFLKFNS